MVLRDLNTDGSRLWTLLARRSIPRAAFAVKEYLLGTIVSTMSNNKHSSASLGNSEVLSLKNPVGESILAFSQRPEDGTKSPSLVRRQYSGDVLPDDPSRALFPCDFAEREREAAPFVAESFPEPGDAEALAGRPSDKGDLLSGRVTKFFCDEHSRDASQQPHYVSKLIGYCQQAISVTEED
jgi:hypothetical protein